MKILLKVFIRSIWYYGIMESLVKKITIRRIANVYPKCYGILGKVTKCSLPWTCHYIWRSDDSNANRRCKV